MSKFVLVVVVIATIAAAALIGVGIYVNYPPSTSGTDAYAQALAAAAILVTTIVSGAVIYWLYRLFRWAITLLVSGVGLRDLPPLIILVSLTLAATLFASGATSIWYVAYDLLRVLFVQFPRSVVEIAFNAYLCGVRSSSDCGVQIVGNLANNVARFFTDSFNSLGRVIDILQFFSAWAILAWLLRDFFASADAPETTVGIRAVYRGMTPITRMQLGLAAVVAVGAYLCLCAIVAVSLFKPTERLQQIEPGRFEKQLDLAKLAHDGADSAFAKRFPEKLPDFPKSEQLQGPYYQQLASEYEELSVRWGQLRTEIASEQDRLRDIAADNYNIKNLNRVGDREQANYYLALESWYQKSLSSLFNYLEHCRTAILLVRIGSTADLTGSSPNAPASSDGGSGQASGPPRPAGVFGAVGLNAVSNARRACESDAPELEEVPDRGDFGYSLGVMGSLSGWLLRTESMPLAVITGLIGFGLFGALVSMFVRTATGQITEWAVFGVICRGVSAAIVVFLAAYGGIAIVSQSGSDPNPFVVFVTCLVGAVFSDDVWEWAKKHFLPQDKKSSVAPQQETGGRQAAGSGQQAEAGSGQQAEAGSGQQAEAGSSQQAEAGSSQQAEAGSSQQAEAGSGQQAEAGSGQQAEAGSGQQAEAGSGQQAEAGSGQQGEPGSGRRS
jgi:hypothetical protein